MRHGGRTDGERRPSRNGHSLCRMSAIRDCARLWGSSALEQPLSDKTQHSGRGCTKKAPALKECRGHVRKGLLLQLKRAYSVLTVCST